MAQDKIANIQAPEVFQDEDDMATQPGGDPMESNHSQKFGPKHPIPEEVPSLQSQTEYLVAPASVQEILVDL